MLQRNDLQVGCVGHVQRLHDARNAAQVVGVVSDHQRVVARVDVDDVVGRDQRAQHWHQVAGIFVRDLEDLGLNLAGGDRALVAVVHRHRSALQLGVRLRHHLVQAIYLHHGKTLHAQGGEEQVVGARWRGRAVGHQGHGALDSGVHHHIAAGDRGHGAGYGLDLGVVEVQGDRLGALGCIGLRPDFGAKKACRAHE